MLRCILTAIVITVLSSFNVNAQCDSLLKLNLKSRHLKQVLEYQYKNELRVLKESNDYKQKILKFKLDSAEESNNKFALEVKNALKVLKAENSIKSDSLKHITKQFRIANSKRIKPHHWFFFGLSTLTSLIIGIWIQHKFVIYRKRVINY